MSKFPYLFLHVSIIFLLLAIDKINRLKSNLGGGGVKIERKKKKECVRIEKTREQSQNWFKENHSEEVNVKGLVKNGYRLLKKCSRAWERP